MQKSEVQVFLKSFKQENNMNEYERKEFTARIHKDGIVLSDKKEGDFLILRCAGDLENLKKLLNSITMSEGTL